MSLITAKRFTLAEYHRLAELGFFGEDDRVELIKGEIVQMAGDIFLVCSDPALLASKTAWASTSRLHSQSSYCFGGAVLY